MVYIETPRLILRDWKPDDLAPFAAMNADPAVMEYFPRPLTQEESAAFYERIHGEFARCGYGPYAVESRESGEFVGFVGFHRVEFQASFTPCEEIMWRLKKEVWGRGYAPEAALAALDYGFGSLGFDQVYAFTTLTNLRSQRVMQKIGMERTGEFDHPLLPAGHPLLRHVLYRIAPAENQELLGEE